MKNKPIHVSGEEELLEEIIQEVKQRVHVDPKVVRNVFIGKFFFFFLFISLGYAGIFFSSDPLFSFLSYLIFGFSSLLFAFNFSHDLAHDAVFRSKKLNHLFFNVIYSLMGAHGLAWKERHIQAHHVAPNVDQIDPDLQILWIFRMCPSSPHLPIHRFQHIYATFIYAFYSLFWIFVKDPIVLFSGDSKHWKHHLSFWVGKCSYLTYMLILPIAFSGQSVWIIILAFVCLHLLQSLFLAFTFLITHHVENTAYPESNEQLVIQMSWVMNQITSSNDFYPFSRTANFIFGGFNNHVAHHLFPQTPHIYYPEISKIVYSILESKDIHPSQTSYFGGIRSHLKFMFLLGNQQGEKTAITA